MKKYIILLLIMIPLLSAGQTMRIKVIRTDTALYIVNSTDTLFRFENGGGITFPDGSTQTSAASATQAVGTVGKVQLSNGSGNFIDASSIAGDFYYKDGGIYLESGSANSYLDMNMDGNYAELYMENPSGNNSGYLFRERESILQYYETLGKNDHWFELNSGRGTGSDAGIEIICMDGTYTLSEQADIGSNNFVWEVSKFEQANPVTSKQYYRLDDSTFKIGWNGTLFYDFAKDTFHADNIVVKCADIINTSNPIPDSKDVDTLQFKTKGIVTLEMFGSGNGSTSDNTAFTDMLAYANNFDTRTLHLMKGKTYNLTTQLDIKNIKIEGNGAVIKTQAGTDLFKSSGDTVGYSLLTEDARKGQSWVKVPLLLLNAVDTGDIIKIIADSIAQPVENENVRIGEMHKVWKVDVANRRLIFKDYLFADYYTTDNVRASKVNMIHTEIRDLSIIYPVSTTNETAISFGMGTLVVDNLTIENAYLQGIVISDNYNSYINNYKAFNSVQQGQGYAFANANASMYTKLTNSSLLGFRHATTTAGTVYTVGANIGGISWGTVISNCTGSSGLNGSAIFDSHASCGDITYIGCKAFGGIAEDFISTTEWAAGTAYSVGDTTKVGNEYFRALVASTGTSPITDTTETNWVYLIPNSQGGYHVEALNNTLIDCEVYGTSIGVTMDATDCRKVRISNFYGENVRFLISAAGGSYTEQLYLSNITLNNSFNKKKVYAVVLSGGIGELYANQITSVNGRGFLLTANTHLPATLVMSNVTAERDYNIQDVDDAAIVVGTPLPSNYLFSNIFVKNMAVARFPNSAAYDTINSININSITNIGNIYYAFDFQQPTRNINISNFTNDITPEPLIYIKLWIDYISLNSSIFTAESVFEIRGGGTLNKYSKGNSVANITTAGLYEFHNNVRGSNSVGIHEIVDNYNLRGWSSPEGIIPARLGAYYTNKTGTIRAYLKTTNDGASTGWTQLSVP